MKNITCYLILLISSNFAFSQSNQIPTGSYYSEDEGTGFYFIVNDKNEFQLSISQGKITNDTISNLELQKQKTPTFGIKYLENNANTDSLTITFPIGFKKYHLSQIFIATKNDSNDRPTYIKTSELNQADFYEDKDLTFKIEKSKYILLLEETYKKDSNVLYEYEIPKNVSKIEITYHPTKSKQIKLHATYDSINDKVIVNENGRNNPITFYKDFDKHLEEFKVPYAITNNIIWNNEETVKPSTSNYKTPYNYVLKTFNNFNNAFQTAKNENKLLLVFYLPEGNLKEQNYTTFAKNYEQKLSNLMYDSYKSNYDKFHLYLITQTDKDAIKELNLKENQLVVLDNDKSIIYRHKAPLAELSKEVMEQTSSYGKNDFNDMQLMKHIDDAVMSKKFDAKKTQRIFDKLTSITSFDFLSGHESILNKTYREKEYIKNNIEYYKLQSNLEQVNQLYDQLIESHKLDETIDFKFASIISKILAAHYNGLLYKNFEPTPSEADLKSIDYLLKFLKEINNYQPMTGEDQNHVYDFYNIKFTISSYLNNVANKADEMFIQKIKPRFKALNYENSDYLSFLKKYIPKDYLNEYMSYYNTSNLHNNENIIIQLDKMYVQDQSKKGWEIYKSQIANQANEAAWVVVEKIDNKKLIREALKWSNTSLQIRQNNPYYLDTYAQLLYKNGDKKAAIEHQTKAVDIISKELDRYSSTLLRTTKTVLEKMQNGTY